jgi:choline kinase
MNSQNGQEKLEDASKVTQDRVDALEREVRIWSPSSSVLWAVWGLVQAKEVVEALKNPKEGFEPDFDYLVSCFGGIATAGGR